MAHIVRDTHVACPPAAVFAVLLDIERLPEFSDMTVDIRGGPGRPLQVGDTFEQVVRVAGKELETDWRVVAVEPDRLLHVEGSAPGSGRATLIERVEPEGDGCRVELDVEYDLPLGFLGEMLDKLFVEGRNEEDAETILAKLKALCEGAASGSTASS